MTLAKERVGSGYFGLNQDSEARNQEIRGLEAQAKGGFNKGTEAYLQELRDLGYIQPGMNCLVIGSGYGLELKPLGNYFDRLTATDINGERLIDISEMACVFGMGDRVDVAQADGTNLLQFTDSTYDAVYTRTLDQHLTELQRSMLNRERKRVSRPGGLVIVEDLDITRFGLPEVWDVKPESEDFEWLHERMIAYYVKLGLEPQMGRKLEGVSAEAGMPSVLTKSFAIRSDRGDPIHYAHYAIFDRQRPAVVAEGLADPEEYAARLKGLKTYLYNPSIDVKAVAPPMFECAGIVPSGK